MQFPIDDNGHCIIPEGVTDIGDYAFSGCWNLTSIDIPNSVTSIGHGAFAGCTGLACIKIPNSVTSIKWGTFEGCTALTNIEIPNSIIKIGSWAFKNCTSLTSFKTPNSTTSIGRSTFNGCTGLTRIKIPNSVKSIGPRAFAGCTNLTSIVSESIKTPDMDKEDKMSDLEEEEEGFQYIDDIDERIEWDAFLGCINLKKIYFPQRFNKDLFVSLIKCEAISEVHIKAEDPNTQEVEFNEEDVKNITLYVPIGTGYAYRRHPEFRKFKEVKIE